MTIKIRFFYFFITLFITTSTFSIDSNLSLYSYYKIFQRKISNNWQLLTLDNNGQQRYLGMYGNIGSIEFSTHYKNHTDDTDILQLKTLYTEFDINDNISVRLGKIIENWQLGYVFSPLSVVDPYSKNKDLENKDGNILGINSFVVNYFDNEKTIAFYGGFDSNKKDTIRDYGYSSYGIKLNQYITDNTDISFVLHKKKQGRLGFGAGFRSIVSDSTNIYGSFFAREGTNQGIHSAILNNNAEKFFTTNPIDNFRLKDNKFYLRAMLGINYTTLSNINIIAELGYDARSMNNEQWRTYKNLVKYHKRLAPVLKKANLNWDLQLAKNTFGLRNLYGFIRFKKEFNDYDITFSNRIAKDLSMLLTFMIQYNISNNFKMGVSFSKNIGDKGTEYGAYYPFKNESLLYLSYDL